MPCLPNIKKNCNNRSECTWCDNYSYYEPADRKILSPPQIEKKEQRKLDKKEAKKNPKSPSQIGKQNKAKGSRLEREAVKLLQSWGYDAERVPLSGAFGHTSSRRFSGDIQLKIDKATHYIEVKGRKDGFTRLYGLLDNYPMVVMRGLCRITKLARNLDDEIKGLTNIKSSCIIEPTKQIQGFFLQDNCDLLLLKSNFKDWILCIKENS